MGTSLYAVSGSQVYSLTTAFASTALGSISAGQTGPCSMIDNGTQLGFCDGASFYLVSGGAISTPSLPFGNPVSAAYQDGFGLLNSNNTQAFYQSNLKDLSTWQALNFSSADADSDNIVAVANLNRVIWIFKQYHTENWVNAGLSGFTFQRLQGVYNEVGCAAAFSVATAEEYVFWLSQSMEGEGMVLMAVGSIPRRISTHAIEFAIGSYSTISDAIAYCYQQEGKLFYVLTFPTAGVTWVYDLRASLESGMPVWHQRASLTNGILGRHWGNAYASFAGLNLIGDYQNGNIYAYNLNTLLDNNMTRKWLRSWRALAKPSENPVTFNSLRIDMETGASAVPIGTNPQVNLRWSDDGGHNWSNYRQMPAGPPGKTAQRVKFNRLGSTRRNSGLDRIFELSATDAFKVALIGAELEAA